MSLKTSLALTAAITALGFAGSAFASDSASGEYADKALFIVSSASLEIGGMVTVLAKATRDQSASAHTMDDDAGGVLTAEEHSRKTGQGPRGINREGLLLMTGGGGA